MSTVQKETENAPMQLNAYNAIIELLPSLSLSQLEDLQDSIVFQKHELTDDGVRIPFEDICQELGLED